MEYKILIEGAGSVWKTDFERAAQELSHKVNEAIRNGWEPVGGVNVGQTVATQAPYLIQAMIRRG